MVQNVKKLLQDIISWKEREILKQITLESEKKVYDIGLRLDKKFFKYIAINAMNRERTPRVMRDENGKNIRSTDWSKITWKPLTPNYVRRKKHRRKWYNLGELMNFFRNEADAIAYYGLPKTKHDLRSMKIEYRSPLSKSLTLSFFGLGHNSGWIPFSKESSNKNEVKLAVNEFKRPLIRPMAGFFVGKLEQITIADELQDYLRRKYNGK